MILITGATGHLGSAVIEALLKNTDATRVAAFVRDANKASNLKEQGINVRVGDFNDKQSLNKAMEGVERVLLISTADPNRFQQHKNVVDAAVEAGVKFLAYTGVSLKSLEASNNQGLMESHFQTDAYIKQSGLTYALLHNTLYMDVLPMFTGEKAVDTGIFLPAGDGKVPFALRSEMGEGTAEVLLNHSNKSKEYNITGSEFYSFQDVAQALSELSGKTVTYADVPVDAFEAKMKELQVPDFAIQMTIGFATDIKNGLLELPGSDLETLLGRKTTDLKTALKELYQL